MPLPDTVRVEQAFSKESDTYKDLMCYVYDQISALKMSWQTIHEEKVAKWRRLYRGIPKDPERNFPWKNASNVVIQLIGENVGILVARTLGTIWEIMPLWPTQLIGEWDTQEGAGAQQEATHAFLNLMGMEPTELDLYRVEKAGAEEMYKYGTVMYKLPWMTETEAEVVGQVEGSNKVEFSEFTKYDGPRPEMIDMINWAASPKCKRLEDCPFKFHLLRLTKQQLEERIFKGVYKFDSTEDKEAFLSQPDNEGPSNSEAMKQQAQNLQPASGFNNGEWEIYECWFPFKHNGKTYRIICSYHYNSKRCLRAIFNFYTKNEEPWEMARFGSEEGLLGFGLCEMLEYYQEEVSTGHNQRVDNRTLANSSILRVDPDSKLDTIFSIYPNALVPARVDEIEKIQLGSNYPSSVQEEQLTIMLAKNLVGTADPGMEGAGGGTVSKKGVYSSMGTFSVMQAGNRRVNINITDFRYTHLKLGRKFLNQYCQFGIGERVRYFGKQAEFLKKALENIKRGRLNLPIRAATASINKELEKQNDMLLTQVMARHHMSISQILQAVSNPQLPPEIKQFMVGWIDSSSLIMARILRNFGHDDISRLLPERKLLEGATNAGQGQQGAGPVSGAGGTPTGAAPPQQSMVPTNSPQLGGNAGMGGQAGMGNVPALPERTM
jgi:hypothetical protein